MRRRDFLVLTSAAVASWPLTARAQQQAVPRAPGGRPWLIGALVGFSLDETNTEIIDPFVKGLNDLSYMEGRDFRIELRYDDGDVTRDDAMAHELVALTPDMLITSGGAEAVALRNATATIPILASSIVSSSLDQLVGKNLAHPSGNVTGIVSDSVAGVGKQCELALEVVPGAHRLGVLVWSLDVDGGAAVRQVALTAAAALKVAPLLVDVAEPADIGPAFRSLSDAHADAIVVGRGSAFASNRPLTVAAAAAVAIPTVYNQATYVEAGGLISYSATSSRVQTSTRLASFADSVLRGAKPADLPVEQDPGFSMAINLKTAKALGLTIPATVQFRADEVIQ